VAVVLPNEVSWIVPGRQRELLTTNGLARTCQVSSWQVQSTHDDLVLLRFQVGNRRTIIETRNSISRHEWLEASRISSGRNLGSH